MHNMINVINTAVCYIRQLLGDEILRVFITRKKMFFSCLFSFYLYEMMDVH